MTDLWHVSDQLRIKENQSVLTITVHPHFSGFTFFVWGSIGGVWLIIGGIYLIGALFDATSIGGALFAVFFWLIGPLIAAIQLLYMFYGEERLTVTDQYLIKSKAIMALKYSSRFKVGKISNIRKTPKPKSTSGMGKERRYDPRQGGTVAFDYLGKMVTFGMELSDEETMRVISALQEKLQRVGSS